MGFDPKKYLQKKGAFDPNAYLQGRGAPPDATTPLPPTSSGGADSFGAQMVSNIPESAGKFAENMAQPFIHPMQTAENIGRLLWAGLKIGPGGMGGNLEDRQAIAPLIQDVVNRYGGPDNLANTIKTDPVGFLGDLSMLIGGGGAAMKSLGEGGKLGEVGSVVGKTAGFVDPVAAPLNVAKAGITSILKPESQYAKALKPPTNLRPGAVDKLISTGLSEKLVPSSKAHYETLLDRIDELNTSVQKSIDASARGGTAFNADPIITRIEELKKTFRDDPEFGAISKKLDDYTQELLDNQGDVFTVDKAQRMKQRAYKGIKDVFDEKTGERIPTLKKQWRAAYADALRTKIAELVPEVAGLNERESRLLNLKPHIEKALERREQFTMGGYVPLSIAAGGAGKGTVLLLAREIVNSPSFRSRLAFALDEARKRTGTRSKVLTPATTVGRVESNTPPTPEE